MNAKIVCIIVLLLVAQNINASGILGQAIKDVGNLVGSEEIKRSGEALDDAHRNLKNKNHLYKNIEEGGSRMVRDAFRPLCIAPYQAMTNWTIARCANWSGRIRDRGIINDAKQLLIDAKIFKGSDFNGVEIRWCPLSGAHGMAPDRGKILLDTPYMHGSVEELAILLGHEMKHIVQYRKMGSDNFKCTYSRHYVECGGCQDEGHRLEREAYDFEEYVYKKIYDLSGDRPNISVASKVSSGHIDPVITDYCIIRNVRLEIDEFDNVYPHGRRMPPSHPRCAFDIVPARANFAYCVNRQDGAVLSRDGRGWFRVGGCRRAW